MRTVYCSGHLPRGWCLSGGGVCLGVVSAWGDVCLEGENFPPPDRILDACLWKHYLSATSFVDSKNVQIANLAEWPSNSIGWGTTIRKQIDHQEIMLVLYVFDMYLNPDQHSRQEKFHVFDILQKFVKNERCHNTTFTVPS